MSFLAPGFFLAALAVASGAIALHFLVIRQPPSAALPTTRFVPVARVHIVTVARRPEDLLLLLLRVLLVLLVGAAFARPVLAPRAGSVARVILADTSDAVADSGAVRDSVQRLAQAGDVVIDFGRLSTALVAGIRAGTRLRAAADSVEIVVVSPLASGTWDGSIAEIRRLWPGRIRLVEVAELEGPERPAGFLVAGPAEDPVALAALAAGIGTGDSSVRVLREAAGAGDTSWAESGGALVHWPASGAPEGWLPQVPADTAGAVVAAGTAVVFPFERRWRAGPAEGSVVARWVDGSPAAIERRVGRG